MDANLNWLASIRGDSFRRHGAGQLDHYHLYGSRSAHPYPDAHINTNSYSYSYSYCNSNADRNSNPNSYSYSDCNADPNRNSDSDPRGSDKPYGYRGVI